MPTDHRHESHGQGRVADPAHDKRLKQNRHEGASHSASSKETTRK